MPSAQPPAPALPSPESDPCEAPAVELLRAEVELLHEGLDSLTNDVPWKVNLLCDQMEGVQTELEEVQNAVRALAAPTGPPHDQPTSPAHLLSTPPAGELASS
jgi:hypothetical protein